MLCPFRKHTRKAISNVRGASPIISYEEFMHCEEENCPFFCEVKNYKKVVNDSFFQETTTCACHLIPKFSWAREEDDQC